MRQDGNRESLPKEVTVDDRHLLKNILPHKEREAAVGKHNSLPHLGVIPDLGGMNS